MPSVLTTEAGRVMAPTGGAIDIAGSVVAVPDINKKPAPLDITLKTASTIPAALSLLDLKPFGFLTRAGQPVDLAQGQAHLLGRLQLTPKPRMRPEDVVFSFAGTLSDVTSDRIVKGRALSAASLTVGVDNKGIAIAGPARFTGIPVEGRWTQVFGPEGKGRSEVQGQIELSPATLKALSIQLPESALKGRGRGDFRIDLIRGQAPEFRLTSDLKGLLLSIPEVAWVKPEGTKGRFEVRGRLASPAQIDRITLGANGLEAAGGVRLKADGSLDVARFERVTLEDWFDGAVEITGRGKGQLAAVAITGGRADMRGATFGASEGASEGAGGGGRPPLTVALDGLRITQGIELGAFQGTFDGVAGGMQGQFTGLVNGAAPVAGAVGPDPNGGTAIRITSGDAGGTLAAAGIYASGRGGALDLSLRPLGDKGSYDGSIRINDIRIVNAPGLASLLNSVSVVGLIDELRGKGIVFGNAEGRFRLTPAGVEIAQGSAIGPSLGVSLAGVYYAGEERFDLQGVISPLYLLNGIGQIFSRQRDGLFGFNYRLTGTRNEYKVAVNPLSLLTPGMFREIFRRPPPKFTPQSGG